MKVVVIGSGFGGLSAAIRLQAAGCSVTVVDKRSQPGGRAVVYEQDGFTFDAGPTIVTVPQLIRELFEVAGKNIEDYVKLVRLDPFYNVRFPDGSVFRYNSDREALLAQIRQFNPSDEKGYLRFSKAASAIFEAGLPLMERPFLSFFDMLRVAPDMVRLQTYRSVTSLVNSHLKDRRLRQAFSFHPLLIGGNPFQSPSVYAMIHRLEQEFGVWFPIGGTGALVRGLVTLFRQLHGTLRQKSPVEAITIDPETGRATGVRLTDGEVLAADAVVSNADVAHTYLHLVPPRFRRPQLRRRRYSMSLFVLYFGTDKQYPEMAHHEILMGKRYRALMEDIFQNHHLAEDFALYLHHPTATDPSLAPPGCDSWYVLSPVPNLEADIDWKTVAPQYRDRIVEFLERHYLPDLSEHIVTERFIDPRHFRTTLNSHLGSAFSIEPTLFQSAWFRPHNRSETIPNLYLVGAGTHPGAGIPGVLNSGKIAAELIIDEEEGTGNREQ